MTFYVSLIILSIIKLVGLLKVDQKATDRMLLLTALIIYKITELAEKRKAVFLKVEGHGLFATILEHISKSILLSSHFPPSSLSGGCMNVMHGTRHKTNLRTYDIYRT
jgi:hypothetical protein